MTEGVLDLVAERAAAAEKKDKKAKKSAAELESRRKLEDKLEQVRLQKELQEFAFD